jgi:BetI-type transcriptional repressor, C-terminal
VESPAIAQTVDHRVVAALALLERHSRALADRVAAAAEVTAGSPEPLMALAAFMNTPDDDAREWFLISTEFTLHAIRNPEFAGALAQSDAQARADLIEIIRPLLGAAGASTEVADLDGLLRLVTALREGGLAQSLVEPDTLAHGELERRYLPSILRDLGLRG